MFIGATKDTRLVQIIIVATHEYHLSNGYEKPHSLHYKYRHKGVVFDNNYLGSIQESCSYLCSTVVLPNKIIISLDLHTDVGLHTQHQC